MGSFVHTFLCVVSASIATAACAEADDGVAFFESKIRPVLVEHCYKCHSGQAEVAQGGPAPRQPRGPAARGRRAGRRSCPASPARACSSRRWATRATSPRCPPRGRCRTRRRRLSHVDRGRRPRPAGRAAAVDEAGRRAMTRRAGFWAFRPPARHPVSRGQETRPGPGDDIDRFILAGLEARGLRPARRRRPPHLAPPGHVRPDRPAADARGDRGVRRPTRRPEAYERVVDRLLASPAFGERWGRHWLDVVRYADQIGTANDLFAEHAWRYRDYVIDAFNADKPYDRFIREQIAGDLLPPTSAERASRQPRRHRLPRCWATSRSSRPTRPSFAWTWSTSRSTRSARRSSA